MQDKDPIELWPCEAKFGTKLGRLTGNTHDSMHGMLWGWIKVMLNNKFAEVDKIHHLFVANSIACHPPM